MDINYHYNEGENKETRCESLFTVTFKEILGFKSVNFL